MVKNWLLIISVLFLSCVQNQPSELLIPRDDFRDLLIDLHKFQLDMSLNNLNRDTISILDSLLINSDFSNDLYNSTLLFYSENPKLMFNILNDVKDSLAVSTSDL
jgi:hypothetical protein